MRVSYGEVFSFLLLVNLKKACHIVLFCTAVLLASLLAFITSAASEPEPTHIFYTS